MDHGYGPVGVGERDPGPGGQQREPGAQETIESFDSGDGVVGGLPRVQEALRIQIPLHPGVADDIKRFNGIQWLIDGGFNLTDAVAAFGEKWLHE